MVGTIFLTVWIAAIFGKALNLPLAKEFSWKQVLIFPVILALFKGAFKLIGFVLAIIFFIVAFDMVIWVMLNYVYDGDYASVTLKCIVSMWSLITMGTY